MLRHARTQNLTEYGCRRKRGGGGARGVEHPPRALADIPVENPRVNKVAPTFSPEAFFQLARAGKSAYRPTP